MIDAVMIFRENIRPEWEVPCLRRAVWVAEMSRWTRGMQGDGDGLEGEARCGLLDFLLTVVLGDFFGLKSSELSGAVWEACTMVQERLPSWASALLETSSAGCRTR